MPELWREDSGYRIYGANTEKAGGIDAELIEMLRQDAVEKYKKEHGWIPITERMPKEEEYILVSFENYTLPDIGRYENDGNDKFYPGDDEETYASYGLIVNAWMPLPKPYKEND